MQLTKQKISEVLASVLNSYAQVFFSNNTFLAVTLLIVSFFDYVSGISGLLSVLTGVLLVEAMGMDKVSIKKGLYGFNNLLVGLGIGLNFQLSFELLVIIVFASLLTSFFTFALQGILGKYNLSYLSIPFLFAIWISLLATNSFSALGLSIRGIYSYNELYSLGGVTLLNLYENLEQSMPFAVVVYFKSLGAIFFQYSILAGILISLGLLVYSRIMFSLSVLGYIMALLFYKLFGADVTQLSYSYIGFNYILSSIAIGGYFLYPSSYSYLASMLIMPLVVLLSFGIEQMLIPFRLSVYSLPFNLVVLMFLYSLRFRTQRATKLREVFVHQETPEKNLYLQNNYVTRMRSSGIVSVSLPVMGSWTVNQGYNGKHTHKGDWRHALDFVITDESGKEFRNEGLALDDYYCYGKNVSAPADGYVVEIISNIEDNELGEANIAQNWGNTIVIEHAAGLYSQISHLMKDSVLVKKGEYVKKGQNMAKVGNTGRSPYPHLHFQIQATPYIGSKTIDYPLSNYITSFNNKSRYHAHGTPVEGQVLNNVITTPLITKAFRFSPGQQYSFSLSFPEGKIGKFLLLDNEYTFEVHVDIFKNTYFECKQTGAKAWFSTDGQMHYFSNYSGNRNSFLFYFMLALFKVELGYYNNIDIKDQIPVHFTFSGVKLLIQDFIAPFFMFLKSDFLLQFKSVDDTFSPQEVKMKSEIINKINLSESDKYMFDITIDTKGISTISANINGEIFQAKCIKKEYI